MKEEKFKELSVTKVWCPLTAQIIDASNIAISMFGHDDIKYVNFMMGCMRVLKSMYVDTKVIDEKDFEKIFRVFIYVLEFYIGNPNGGKPKYYKKTITPYDMFKMIRTHWNDDIQEKLRMYNK